MLIAAIFVSCCYKLILKINAMEYFLGLLRFRVKLEYNNGTEENIDSEMTQLVKASSKELAREALLEYWEKESNGAILIEARINDTVCGR